MAFFKEENTKKPKFKKPPLKKNKVVKDFLKEFGVDMPTYKEIINTEITTESENNLSVVKVGCNCCKIC